MTPPSQVKKTCILGGGICALASARKRELEGKEVTIIEARNRLGGIIQSENLDGFQLDYGPNTLNLRLNKTEDFLRETDILEHAIDANANANKRYVVRNGKLVALPRGPLSFLSSGFLSPLGKLRLLLEPFLPRGKDRSNESVAAFVSRRLGKEALEYGANPFLAGVYAARPESLCLRHTFPSLHKIEEERRSLFLGMLSGWGKAEKTSKTRLLSFPKGMSELPARLKGKLNAKFITGHEVKQVSHTPKGWVVKAEGPAGAEFENGFDEVICAIPAHKLQSIQWTQVQQAEEISSMAQASHFPLSLVFMGFDVKDLTHPLDGFGFLVPEAERLDILGSIFSSTLFPGRAPTGKVLLTTFVGGERNPELALRDETFLCRKVIEQLKPLLGIKGSPVFQKTRTWEKAIPLPDSGFENRRKSAELLQEANPGLFFSGSHVIGAPLPSCLDVP